MLNSINSIATVIGVLIGIIAALLSILVMIRKKHFASPKIGLSIGPSDPSGADVPKKYRKQLPSIMAIIPDKPTKHPLLSFLFVGLENRGKESLKNVRLVLEYKKRYLVDNKLFESVSQIEPTVVKSRTEPDTALLIESQLSDEDVKKALTRREVVVFGQRAQISYEIPIVRQGEGVVFSDLLLLRGEGPDDFKELPTGEGGFQNILRALRKIKTLEDYFLVSILAFAENHEKIQSELSVLRFSSGTKPDTALLLPFIKALWFGEIPRPGIYFSDRLSFWVLRKLNRVGRLSHKLVKDELGILILAEIAEIRTKKKQTFAVELAEVSAGQYFTVSSPNCDYYALPNHVNSNETLRAWLGIPDKPLKLFQRKGKVES